MNTATPRRSPVRHRLGCSERGPYSETVSRQPTQQAQVIVRCEECNADDRERPHTLEICHRCGGELDALGSCPCWGEAA